MAVQDKDKLVSLEDLKTAYDDLDGDISDVKNTFDDNVGQWHYHKQETNTRYPFIQVDEFGERMYFKLISPTENIVSVYVLGSNDGWSTQTQIYSQEADEAGTEYYADIPSGYTSLRFAVSLTTAYTGQFSAIIHTVDNHTISQNIIDLWGAVDDLDTTIASSLTVIGSEQTGTNYNGFYLNSSPSYGIRSISDTVFNLRKYSVSANHKYYLIGNAALNAALPIAAFGTAEVVDKNNYIEKILDGSTTSTDYNAEYIPSVDGYIYVAWINGKGELALYDAQNIAEAVDELIISMGKDNVKIQLFGDSITDNQWGDNFTWANYIQQMMPDYTVTVVNDAVGGSGIGHGKSTTTGSHQSDEYNFVWDLVTDGTTLQTDADAVVILCGTNNWASSSDLGDMSSTGYNTIYGALKGILEYISAHSAATVFICTVPQRYNSADQSKPTNSSGEPLDNNGVSLAEFCVPFEKVSGFYGMPCIHLNSALGWNRLNISNFTTDGLHPNTKGDLMLAKFICSELMKHI